MARPLCMQPAIQIIVLTAGNECARFTVNTFKEERVIAEAFTKFYHGVKQEIGSLNVQVFCDHKAICARLVAYLNDLFREEGNFRNAVLSGHVERVSNMPDWLK